MLRRQLAIAERRHYAHQKREVHEKLRTKFDPKSIKLSELQPKKWYLLGFVFMPRHCIENFEHFETVMAKDFCHLRYPANGSLGCYAWRNAAGHIDNPILGGILACEDATSWDVFDTTITSVIPGALT